MMVLHDNARTANIRIWLKVNAADNALTWALTPLRVSSIYQPCTPRKAQIVPTQGNSLFYWNSSHPCVIFLNDRPNFIAHIEKSCLRHTKVLKPVMSCEDRAYNMVLPVWTSLLHPPGSGRWTAVECQHGQCQREEKMFSSLILDKKPPSTCASQPPLPRQGFSTYILFISVSKATHTPTHTAPSMVDSLFSHRY